MPKCQYVLKLSCLNRPGIVAAVSTYLFEKGGDIREAQQFDDAETGKFFARIAFDLDDSTSIDALRAGFSRNRRAFPAQLCDHRSPSPRAACCSWSPNSTIAWSICCIAGASANSR